MSSRILCTNSNIFLVFMLHLNLDEFSAIYIATIMVKAVQKTNSTGNMIHASRAAKPSDVSADYDIASLVGEVGCNMVYKCEFKYDYTTICDFLDDNTFFIYPELIDDAIESKTWCLSSSAEFGLCGCNGNCNDNYNGTNEQIWVRPYNVRDARSMGNMNLLNIDTSAGISSGAIRSSAIIPNIQTIFFEYQLCNNEAEVAIETARIEEPTECTNNHCEGSNCMEFIHNRSCFQNR